MDVLVSTGTLVIYLYSVFMLFYYQSMGHDGASHGPILTIFLC